MRRATIVAAVIAVGFVSTGSAMPGPTASDHPPTAPTGLTVDDDPAPLAVTGPPAFGWVVNDPDRNESQRGYELVVTDAPSSGRHAVLFDSGPTTSGQQSYVHAPGLRLGADRRYWWTVRTQDASGQFGPSSAEAHFDTGLADSDWRASWIRRGGPLASNSDDFALIRKETTLTASPVVRARVYAAAGQQYELEVNGTRAAHGPSFSYPDEQYYETTDITALVQAGRPNVFAFVTHWSTSGQGRPPSPEAFIAHISVDHADGTREVFDSDASWRTHASPWIPSTPRNEEGDFVEHVDERLDPTGWDRTGFDDRGWLAPTVLGTHPWTVFRHLVAARTHVVYETVKPKSLKRLADGTYVADFGAVIAATPVVEIHAGAAGRAVKLVSGDLLDPDGHVSTTRGHQDTDMHWDFDERAGAQEFRPFGYLGFRYLEVVGAAEPLTTVDVTVAARHANVPDEHAATFHTSNPGIDAVWNLARHTALYDTQEQFLDTPTREKGPFLGDSYDVSQATMAAFGERSTTSQALRDFARSQARYWPDGRVNAVYPNGDGKRDIPDSTEDYVGWVWKYWMATGDREQLATLYPVVRHITDYLQRAVDHQTGLVTKLPGGGGDYLYGLVDWPPQMRYGYDMNTAARTTLNVMAVEDFRRAALMAQALGKPSAENVTESQRARSLTLSIVKELERPDGLFVDGLRSDGTRSTHVSQQANAYALSFGIVPAEHVATVTKKLVDMKSAMGVVNYRVLLDALHDGGRDDALVTDLTDPNRPGYAQILKQGATFTWESWNARAVGDSESHGWGSTVLAVLQDDVLGARVSAPGGAEVEIAVPKSTLTNATGIVSTQRGPIPIGWTRDGAGRERIDVTIPVNVTATVHLAGTSVAAVSESHRSLTDDPGVSKARFANGEVAMTAGSGHYVFETSPPTVCCSTRAPSPFKHHSNAPIIVAVAIVLALGLFFVTLAVRRRRAA
ncbi:MAG: alpha-L-rhamnosidase domain protein [Actinomycetia bacterium]|nr:alpha-L-rhamnosidase domain protein [Actinomycetes bacterium]